MSEIDKLILGEDKDELTTVTKLRKKYIIFLIIFILNT